MATTTAPDERTSAGSWLYDPKVRGLFFQIALLAALVFAFWWIVDNTITNLEARDKKSGFGFLEDNAGFGILTSPGTYFLDYSVGQSSYADVFWVGVINTLFVAFLGVAAATILGFIMGVLRLSKNAVLSGFATVYVEVLRNIPLLLQIFFWYFFVLRALPGKRERITWFGEAYGLNITGLYGPFPLFEEGAGLVAAAFVVTIVVAWLFKKWADKHQAATGERYPVFWIALAVIVAGTGLTYVLAGMPLSWEYPEFRDSGPILRRGYQDGMGMVVKPEFIALWLALTLYTASFIAEIVRAGILAVSHGQTEASYALGLRPGTTLQLVIIPQALRVIIPPLTSQYLNLTKNSSLAVAIAYPDVVSVFAGTALNQVGQEIEMIFMMMMVYLTISIATSLFMNWFNSRMKLVER